MSRDLVLRLKDCKVNDGTKEFIRARNVNSKCKKATPTLNNLSIYKTLQIHSRAGGGERDHHLPPLPIGCGIDVNFLPPATSRPISAQG